MGELENKPTRHKERVRLAAEGVGRGHHHTGREVEPEVQGKRIKSQY